MTENKTRNGWADAWLVVSVAVPVLGAAAATHFYRLAAEATPKKPPQPPLDWWQTAQFWLNLWATVFLLLALGVGIAAKVMESRKKSKLEQTIDDQAEKLAGANRVKDAAVALAKLDQLVMVHDELIPVASSIADMARFPLEDQGPYLKNAVRQTYPSAQQD